ncbi:N-acetylneuraminate 9-O-acetyltransferase [Periophthalmus magnuspinnatus]|uniref:N-acetylneuraminate 9-O-acetyltransferase n=1 Tax=Periophthalmus magnuspinnatus TaxID=409849 RepID=UPI00145A699E|nr:N-acetylneuraminate 9-O-acetyltransferase [Periophthalmus magnuspinnatus]
MATLAYSLGKLEINQYFTIKNAKLISLFLALVLLLVHSFSGLLNGSDSCQRLLSTGRFLGNNVWQPEGCMMHTYTSREASTCLNGKKVIFIGDSRIRALFISFISIIASQKQSAIKKHADISFRDNSSAAQVHFVWSPWTNNSMKERLILVSKEPVKPDALIIGAASWIIRDFKGSAEGLHQYKVNLTSMSPALERLAEHGEVYWHIQEPVNWRALSLSRRMITDQQIDLYNEAAAEALGFGRTHIRPLTVSRLAALETLNQSADGLHMADSSVDVGAMAFMNSLCNKVIRPIDGSCCQNMPPLTFLQKMALCVFLASILLFLLFHFLRKRPHRRPVAPDLESLEEKKPATATGPLGPEAVCGALCRMGLIMVYFYLCDRADVFMKEQKYYSHSAFFIPLINVFVLGLFCNESTKESRVLNREQTDEWKGWMQLVILIYHISGASAFIPVYMHVRVLVAAYLFQTGYGHFSFFWLKGDFGLYRLCQVLFRLNFLVLVLCAVMDRPYQFYYFVPLVSFWFVIIYSTLAMWPQIVQKKASNSALWYLGILLKLLGLLLLICLFAYSQDMFESTFTAWPLSELFELNGNIHEWWFRWRLDRFAVVQGMLFAFLYLLLQKKQVLSETRGDTLFSAKVSLPMLLLSGLSFITYSVWASNCQTKAQCNEMHPYISVVPILAFILIRNIPGFARSVYSSFFAWFGKISLELFICQYHIWLAADTKGILVLIPGNPPLNILVSSFIFVCVAHEISLITNILAQLLIPKDTVPLLKRLGAVGLLTLLLGAWGHPTSGT